MTLTLPTLVAALGLALQDVATLRVHPLDDALLPQAQVLAQALGRLGVEGVEVVETGLEGEEPGEGEGVVPSRAAGVRLELDAALPAEGYRVLSESGDITVTAADTAGAAHAVADLVRRVILGEGTASWEDARREERPDFPYRSFMVDMGRNPHSPATLRHVVDMVWFHRGNYLQLHLTDDQLFSWPSASYPELQSPHAGWSLQDFQALEAYSQARGVTLVPELEVPGHSSLLRSRRPDVFGTTTLELATSPQALAGVQTLLAEMLAVFQATPYVHIGADEVGGVPQEDQRAFINRLNAFLRDRGRTTVVWEGPGIGEGENKVSEDVVQMAWESRYVPMPAMVEAGYQVVNAAWDPFYVVDHYPRNNFTGVPVDELYAVDLRRMKNVDPGLPSFHRPQLLESTEGVLGFCMPYWEGREQNLLPLCVARYGAAAARAWDYDSQVPYSEFAAREAELLPRLEAISGFELPELPMAAAEDEVGNLAFRARVTPSRGQHQPHFVPQRLTNGITDQFDLFLGYPAKPEPLVIDLELREVAEVSRVRVHEISVGSSWERYRLLASSDGEHFVEVGSTSEGDRGDAHFVEHRFERQLVRVLRIETSGCERFTFPSFSRLTEVEAFAD